MRGLAVSPGGGPLDSCDLDRGAVLEVGDGRIDAPTGLQGGDPPATSP